MDIATMRAMIVEIEKLTMAWSKSDDDFSAGGVNALGMAITTIQGRITAIETVNDELQSEMCSICRLPNNGIEAVRAEMIEDKEAGGEK
jgi:hypothetical protein